MEAEPAAQAKGASPFLDKAVAFQAARRAGLNLEPAVGLGCFLDPLDVVRVLQEAGEDDPFLLVAAVLHDRMTSRGHGNAFDRAIHQWDTHCFLKLR